MTQRLLGHFSLLDFGGLNKTMRASASESPVRSSSSRAGVYSEHECRCALPGRARQYCNNTIIMVLFFIMAYYNRFEGNYDEEMQRIYERRQAVIDAARQKVPSNLDELLADSEDEGTDYELEWVDVPNPKVSGS